MKEKEKIAKKERKKRKSEMEGASHRPLRLFASAHVCHRSYPSSFMSVIVHVRHHSCPSSFVSVIVRVHPHSCRARSLLVSILARVALSRCSRRVALGCCLCRVALGCCSHRVTLGRCSRRGQVRVFAFMLSVRGHARTRCGHRGVLVRVRAVTGAGHDVV